MNLKLGKSILCFLIVGKAMAQQPFEINQKVKDLVSKMTLEEKVGQMTNVTLQVISKDGDNPVTLDMDKLRDVIVKHNIGSIQNAINHAYSLEEWHHITQTIQEVSMKETRLKIPSLYAIDAVHGTNNTLKSTLFPHNLAMAATRNPELARLAGEITAKEVRASGIRLNWSPVLDLGRQPLWPRFPETFGEDVYIDKTMGVATIKGYEGKNIKDPISVASCMKHYVGYSAPGAGKDRTPAHIPEIELREYYLPSFKAAIDAGSHTVMINSGEVNGTPVHASKFLLTEVLRKELGFKGIISSDWEDIKKLHERHKVASTNKEAAMMAVNAGIDFVMVPYDLSFYNDLIELVKEGKVSIEKIDDSVNRILQLKYELGYFENPYLEKEAVKNFGQPEYRKAALDAARECVILLKNEKNLLPLPKNKKILVVGPASASLTSLNGCWSYTWQGTDEKYFQKDALTITSAIKAKNGEANVQHFQGTDFDSKDIDIAAAVKAAKDADYIVVCLGENAYAETVGNINDLELPEIQQKLVKELSTAGKPMVLILTEGRPRIIRKIEKDVQGILLANWPGSQGAEALAEVLFGEYNPDGILPYTYPRFSGEILTYDHKPLDEAVEEVIPAYKYSYVWNPQFEFGQGLSYTSFEYSDLVLSSDKLASTGTLKISVTLKNTGKTAGKHTIELYSRDLFASITPSVKRLRKFQKISLSPGSSQKVEFEINKSDLAFVNEALKTVTEPGEFEITIGNLKKTFNYSDK
jgi:beta-glucosidase